MIRNIDYGLFVKQIGGGYGGLTFSLEVSEGYLIRNGQIAEPVKGLNLTGEGIEVIKHIDRVGSKLVTEDGSYCGATSGLLPVTSFQPRMRLAAMKVGGVC